MDYVPFLKDWSLGPRPSTAIPGPFFAKLTRLWQVWRLLCGTYRPATQELHKLYGKSESGGLLLLHASIGRLMLTGAGIKSVMVLCGYRSKGVTKTDPAAEVLRQTSSTAGDSTAPDNVTDQYSFSATDLEARIALALAGADPAIMLILKTLQHVQSNPNGLLQYLRCEFNKAGITSRPSFRDLIHAKTRMPGFYAVLDHCLHLSSAQDLGSTYVSPAGGISFDGLRVPEGHLITVETAILDTNLTPGHAPLVEELVQAFNAKKDALPAYNLRKSDHTIEEFLILIAAKVVVPLLHNIVFDDGSPEKVSNVVVQVTTTEKSVSENVAAEPQAGRSADAQISGTTSVKLSHMDTFIGSLGVDKTDILLARFDPGPNRGFKGDTVTSKRLPSSRDRAILHEALGEVYGARIDHRTDPSTLIVHIGPKGFNFKNSQARAAKEHQGNLNGPRTFRNNSTPRPPVPGPSRLRTFRNNSTPRPPVPGVTSSAWGVWAVTESNRVESFKTDESWEKQKQAMAETMHAANKETTRKYQETYKQTGTKTTNGRLGGPRVTLRTDITTHVAQGGIMVSSCATDTESSVSEKSEVQSPPRPREGWMPPHKRAQLLREKKEAEAIAAAESTRDDSSGGTDTGSSVSEKSEVQSPPRRREGWMPPHERAQLLREQKEAQKEAEAIAAAQKTEDEPSAKAP